MPGCLFSGTLRKTQASSSEGTPHCLMMDETGAHEIPQCGSSPCVGVCLNACLRWRQCTSKTKLENVSRVKFWLSHPIMRRYSAGFNSDSSASMNIEGNPVFWATSQINLILCTIIYAIISYCRQVECWPLKQQPVTVLMYRMLWKFETHLTLFLFECWPYKKGNRK